MNQTKIEAEKLPNARRLYREELSDAEIDQAVEEILSFGDSYVHEFSVRILAAIIQEKVRERGGPFIVD